MTDDISNEMDRSLLSIVRKSNEFIYVYVASEQALMVMDNPEEILPADYDPRTRPWYITAKKLGAGSFTEPYRDATTGDMVISGLAPIKNNGQFTGVAAGDISLDYIANMLSLVNFSETGQVFLVSKSGDYLSP